MSSHHQHQLFSTVLQIITQFKAFRNLSKTRREGFAYDISLIALSIRTGFLVDTIQIPESLVEETFTSLLSELRSVSKHFDNVLHLFEPSANQSIFVNTPLLVQKLKALPAINQLPVFVHLPGQGDPNKLDAPPASLLTILEFLRDHLEPGEGLSNRTLPLRLPSDLPSTMSIPLAATLLDYPVAYVPASVGQTSFLSGVPLVLYRCRVHIRENTLDDGGREHLLLQFSCPEIFTDDMNGVLSIENTISCLESTFQHRITQSLGDHSTFNVEWERITLDRVAL